MPWRPPTGASVTCPGRCRWPPHPSSSTGRCCASGAPPPGAASRMSEHQAPFLGEVTDGIAWATFNRPQALNAYSEPMRDLLLPFLRRVEADPAVRCVVLRGAGGNFMAGGDVKSFTDHLAKSPLERQMTFEALCHSMNPIIYTLRRMPKPVVASVAGACAGLGFSFVLAADLALAADSASFTFAYPKIGATPDGGASFFLPRTLGLK